MINYFMAEQLGVEGSTRRKESNPFGFLNPDFIGLSEAGKKGKWREEGGQDFKGPVGEVKRYVRGVSGEFASSENNVFPGGRRNILAKFVSNTEGSGVYATTNPNLAAQEYGPGLMVVDIALGREASPDNSSVLRILDRIKGPIRGISASYVTAILLFEVLSLTQGAKLQAVDAALTASALIPLLGQGIPFKLFQKLSEYDSLTVKPHAMPTILNKIKEKFKGIRNVSFAERHKRWVVVKDPKRVKVVKIYDSFDEFQKDP